MNYRVIIIDVYDKRIVKADFVEERDAIQFANGYYNADVVELSTKKIVYKERNK